MSKMIQLHAVAPKDLGKAIDYALEYRWKLPIVCIVAENRNGRFRVCAPCIGGDVEQPIVDTTIEFISYDAAHPTPDFRIVFGPGVLPKRKGKACREKSKAATEARR